jgi:hypothetical protein
MELFGIKSEVFGVIIAKDNAIYVYLCCNIITVPKKMMGIARIIKAMSGKCTHVLILRITLIKGFYTQETVMPIISVTKPLTV